MFNRNASIDADITTTDDRAARRFRRPSAATVIASVALFSSLGGVGYAAATIGSGQIKNNSVQGQDIKNGTIKSADISKGTRDGLKGQTGKTGAQGQPGQPGQPGQQGAPGTPGAPGATSVVTRVASGSVPGNSSAIVSADCAAGEKAVGGGGSYTGAADVELSRSVPTVGGNAAAEEGETAKGWRVDYANNTNNATPIRAFVICAAP